MDIDIIGKLNEWNLFICKNVFGLLFRKAEICRRTWKEQSFVFTVYLMNYLFQTSALFKRMLFTREILSRDDTRPRMKSSLSMVKYLLLFTCFCRDEIRKLTCLNTMKVWTQWNQYMASLQKVKSEKGWAQEVKNKKCKNIFIPLNIFFMTFRKDWSFHLL